MKDKALSPYRYLSITQKMKTLYREFQLNRYPQKNIDFLIVGAQKAGTTALFATLKKHSGLTSPVALKELHYFSNDEWYEHKKITQYHSFFPIPKNGLTKTKYFEVTPGYLYHPKVAVRLKDYHPSIKIIVLLRNPTERAFSAWKMRHYQFKSGKAKQFHDNRSFREAIENELHQARYETRLVGEANYINQGLYAKHLIPFLRHFDKNQLLIMESSWLRSQPQKTLNTIMNFLEVNNETLVMQQSNQSSQHLITEEDKKTLQLLNIFFKEKNEQLFEQIGISYDW